MLTLSPKPLTENQAVNPKLKAEVGFGNSSGEVVGASNVGSRTSVAGRCLAVGFWGLGLRCRGLEYMVQDVGFCVQRLCRLRCCLSCRWMWSR